MKKITLLLCSAILLNASFVIANVFNEKTNGINLNRNEAVELSVKTAKDTYKPGEAIIVNFSGLPGSQKDWITLINPDASSREYGNWKYTKGKTSGSLTFDGMQEGDYEVRVYFGTDYTIQARYPFKVIKNADTPSLEQTIENSPAKNYIYSLIERLDELETLKNSPDWGSELTMLKYTGFLETAPIHLQNVKSFDPNFDVSGFQKRLDGYQAHYDDNLENVNDNNLAKIDFEQLITSKSWKLTNLIDDKLGSGAGWVHSYYNTSNYLKEATEIDYPSLLKITTEGDIKFKGHNLDYKVQAVKEFGEKYLTFYNETLHSVINGLIEGAYENKTKNAQEAIKYAAQAKELSDAALLILPNDVGVKSLNQDATTTYENVVGAVLANVYASDFHEEHAGEIVFFTKKPSIKAENTSTVNANYIAGEYIYAVAYLKGSFKDLTKATNTIQVTIKIFVDGNEKASHLFAMSWAMLQEGKTYLFMEIVPDPATNKQSGPAKFANALANVSPRNHTIKVTLNAMQQGTSFTNNLAEGEFQLDCSNGQEKLSAYAVKYREKSLADIYMPTAKMDNTTLANSMKNALQNNGWENGKKIQRVVITGSDWKITKHATTGKILYRSIPAAVAFKTDAGECKYWNLTFKQTYNGSSYGQTEEGGVGSIVDMSCENVY